jgi:uncharacterized membrane protein YeaQ/YmgE (transglycosylase-associated protein family)
MRSISAETLLIIALIGLVAGWLAGQIVKGSGFGVLNDILIGIVGAFIGSWLLSHTGIHLGTGLIAEIARATIGAVVLLLLVRLIGGGYYRRGYWGHRRRYE